MKEISFFSEMFFHLLIIAAISVAHCFSNGTKIDPLLISNTDKSNRTDVMNDTISSPLILCHCRHDFTTIYFDAVDPFIPFAGNNTESPCQPDKTCKGVLCITVGKLRLLNSILTKSANKKAKIFL